MTTLTLNNPSELTDDELHAVMKVLNRVAYTPPVARLRAAVARELASRRALDAAYGFIEGDANVPVIVYPLCLN